MPADPLCINSPASVSAPPELFLFNSNSASDISKFVVLTDVVVPLTVMSPPICMFPVSVRFLIAVTSMLPSATIALFAAAVPFVIPSSFSRSVSFMSAEPIMNEPVAVTFLNDPMSLFESTITALEAATVPAVMPSIVSSSASLIAAEPIVNAPAVTVPLNVGASAIDIVSCAPLSVDVEMFVSPWKNNLSVPSAISMSVESSPTTFKIVLKLDNSVSTYALTDCCVGISVAELDVMLSSSANAVTVIVPSLIDPNCIVPLAVKFLNDDASLLASTTTALLAATVPAVMPSICSSSASLIAAEPIVNPPAVTVPLNVGASAIDIVSCAPLSVDVEIFLSPWKYNLSVPSAISMSVESSPTTFKILEGDFTFASVTPSALKNCTSLDPVSLIRMLPKNIVSPAT